MPPKAKIGPRLPNGAFSRRGRKAGGKKTLAPATAKAVTAIAKKVIANAEETKFRSEIVSDRVTHNSQIGFTDIINCLPKLVQDQGEGAIYERLGRKVSVRGCHFHIDIGMADVTRSNNIIVHMWILENRSISYYPRLDSTNTDLGKLLMLGSAAQYQGYNGYAQDAMLPVNTSQFRVLKHKKFFLGKNTGTLQDSTTAGNQPSFTHALNKKFMFKLKAPKVFTYEQDNNSPRTIYYPSNFAPFCVIGYQHVSNSDPDYTNQDITVTARANLWFDDA